MRLIYNDNYDAIDRNMSYSQMGARKKKGCRQNIFMINGIIHDVLSSKIKKPVLFQIYDYKQMFDAINLKEAISDIYDTGLTNDNLSLLYQANTISNIHHDVPRGVHVVLHPREHVHPEHAGQGQAKTGQTKP